MRVTLSPHAREEVERRGISMDAVESVLQHPQQVVPERDGRSAYQSQLELAGVRFLVRAIIDDRTDPAVVVTVYRTKRISKYWRAT